VSGIKQLNRVIDRYTSKSLSAQIRELPLELGRRNPIRCQLLWSGIRDAVIHEDVYFRGTPQVLRLSLGHLASAPFNQSTHFIFVREARLSHYHLAWTTSWPRPASLLKELHSIKGRTEFTQELKTWRVCKFPAYKSASEFVKVESNAVPIVSNDVGMSQQDVPTL